MMISCYYIELKENNDEKLLDFFHRKILDSSSSNLWRRMFLWLRHIHIIALITLFAIGSSDLNNLQNIGYAIFFVWYTAKTDSYRKSGWVLTVFVSLFILS